MYVNQLRPMKFLKSALKLFMVNLSADMPFDIRALKIDLDLYP